MTEVAHLPRLSPAAERMRRHRERRRGGLSCIKVELRRSEVDALVACKLLEPTEREDRRALTAALHRYLVCSRWSRACRAKAWQVQSSYSQQMRL
jgi:hypothetical protein